MPIFRYLLIASISHTLSLFAWQVAALAPMSPSEYFLLRSLIEIGSSVFLAIKQTAGLRKYRLRKSCDWRRFRLPRTAALDENYPFR
ncbi:uncharacterized protein BT62DRAFT_1000449 [Guyanagaster necrorhizus]|uniref:Uncharacterized protein n=1 Tax=Guyanagaster necrorhizus TaxID=856835 RepID=A0A9P7W345_9AGAR|nr:uncharacterized protein BT62DRAFT_1000449 [Guyanagaster necrorhizus MCA 3950]KAG7451199.1 hypothetical protein BT62DRAFT_1000449 [Guyanagaster necrorhizus MCA 3950]